MKVAEPGDVLHFSCFFDAQNPARGWHRDIWAIVIERRSVEALSVLIVTGAAAGELHIADNKNDVGSIVKADDVPDYVLSRVAFYKLRGVDAD